MTKQTIDYIITWLLYGNKDAAKQVAYTTPEEDRGEHRVLILPYASNSISMAYPELSEPEVRVQNGQYVIQQDIVYNTFFFLSNAEEMINRQRDEHGRFIAAYSILSEDKRLFKPMLDVYGHLMMQLLSIPLPNASFSHIYLTHDIDTIAYYRHARGFLGGLMRFQIADAMASVNELDKDAAWTFPWLIEQDRLVPKAKVIYFVKQTKGEGFDYPQYDLHGADWLYTQQIITQSDAMLGVHSSYYGLSDMHDADDWYALSNAHKRYHRFHFLRSNSRRFRALIAAGYTDDFSMGFPDHIGFRMQTCRPFQWIDPKSGDVTKLTIHPLTIMDCTLSNSNYMNLTQAEAYDQCCDVISTVHQYAGEPVLLWHNSNVEKGHGYHHALYPEILKYITSLL